MSDTSSLPIVYVQTTPLPPVPPPAQTSGPIAWAKRHLFNGIFSSVVTVVFLGLAIVIVPDLIRYLFIDAVWSSSNGDACRVEGTGACWSFIWAWLRYFIFGSYPLDQQWRIVVEFFISAALLIWLLTPKLPLRAQAAVGFFTLYPVVSFILYYGLPLIGLPVVDTDLWGGIMVTLLVALVGIVFCVPFGILLALGRRSTMPAMQSFCVIFIEFIRGVPFITVLFMAVHMMPLFVPPAFQPNKFALPLIGTIMFASAYMAEIVRGGLQTMPKGQTEAAQALGMNYWQNMRLIILPQVLTQTLPNIVSNSVGLFMDTTLVAGVGMFDFLKTIEVARIDPIWEGPNVSTTGYIFAGLFFLFFCYGMSHYAGRLEAKLSKARKR